MKQLTVAIHGALGKMGRETMGAVSRDPSLSLTGAVDINATGEYIDLPYDSQRVPLYTELDKLLQNSHPQVLVDFTIAEASLAAACICLQKGISFVTGTSGFSDDNLKEIDRFATASEVGAVVAPNFALSAVIQIYLASIAARFFDHAEIIELHHDQKIDAPSGTALATAKAMAQSRGKPFVYAPTGKENIVGCRGGQVDGIAIHSVRLPGFIASQEIIFGGQGQTLSLRNDAISRESYMAGVILAIKEVTQIQGLVYGLDKLLHLGGTNESL